MSQVASVTLTGAGATGLVPGLIHTGGGANGRPRNAKVFLGRLSGKRSAAVPMLASFLPAEPFAAMPDRIDWSPAAAQSLGRMYANDRMGCCVISGKMHAIGVWTANDSDSGGEVQASDAEVVQQYQSICGPGDRGCYVSRVLDVMTRDGLVANGERYKLDGYVSVEHTQRDQVRAAVALFGSLTLGFNLPESWASSNVWDVTTSRIVGGHDVTIVGYEPRGVFVSSWGRIYLMTWAALEHQRYVEEMYALLAPAWYNADTIAPSGLDVAGLRAALTAIGGGQVPPVPDPTPPTPPVPPDPPTPPTPPVPERPVVYDIAGVIEGGGLLGRAGTFRGVATPRGGSELPDDVELDVASEEVATAVNNALWPVMGMDTQRDGRRLRFKRRGLTPGQWAVLIQAVIAFIQAIVDALNRQVGDGQDDGQVQPGEVA